MLSQEQQGMTMLERARKSRTLARVRLPAAEEAARSERSPMPGIAARIRSLRKRTGMTLEQLAAATGLDKGYLSRVERQEKTPSITTLMKIADAFGVELSRLFGDTLDQAAVTVVRRGERQPYGRSGSGHAYQALFQDDGKHHLSAFVMEPGEGEREIGQHAGDEMIFVLSGSVEVGFADRSIVLEAGDCLRFEGHLTHRIRRLGGRRAEVLIVIARDDGARERQAGPATNGAPSGLTDRGRASRSRSPIRKGS
jgi:transcriptional regulator with XRE-family HTH domain